MPQSIGVGSPLHNARMARGRRPLLRTAAPALILAALVLSPFLPKAFTIDDTAFLRQAQQLLEDPLHPTAFDMVWDDGPKRMSTIMASGPVMAYLLVPAVRLGGSEWVAHAVQLLLLSLAIVATVSLGFRIGLTERAAQWAGLLLAGTPTVLAMSTTAMPDIPAMAFGTIGMERFMAWRTDGRLGQGLAALVAFALGTLARSHAGLLLGVGGLALFTVDAGSGEQRASSPWRRWWPLAGSVILIALVLQVTGDPHGEVGMVGAARRLFTLYRIKLNLFAFLVHLGLCLPLTIPWVVLRFRQLPWRVFGVALPAALLSLLSTHAFARWSWGLIIPLTLIAALSGIALTDIAQDAWNRRDGIQGVLLAWLLIALPVCVYIHLPSKYLAASAPAIALLIARHAGPSERFRIGLLAGVLAAGVGLGALIARADANFAGLGRAAAVAWIVPAVRDGRPIWSSGGWGFQWYAERAGAPQVTTTPPRPKAGDWVIVSKASLGSVDQFPHRRLIASMQDVTPGGRVMSGGAGFYSNKFGFLPWAWSREPLDRIELWEIE